MAGVSIEVARGITTPDSRNLGYHYEGTRVIALRIRQNLPPAKEETGNHITEQEREGGIGDSLKSW